MRFFARQFPSLHLHSLRHTRFRAALAALVFAASLVCLRFAERAHGQEPPPARRPAQTQNPQQTPTPQTQPSPEGQEVDPNELVTVISNEVKLNVRVIDRSNRPINNVSKDEFRVYDNGQLQPITYFTREEVPITYGLVVDNSGSMRTQLEKVIEASKTIVNSNKPGDLTCVVRFIDSQEVKIVQDFTPDKTSLFDALDEMYTEAGQTAILDAVYLSADHVANFKKGNDINDKRRRALILVTDGEDRASYYKQEQLFSRLREDDVQIFVIGFVNELEKDGGLIRKSPHDKAVALINRLAQETGGRAFFPSSLSELPGIAQEITRDLRTQYVIGFKPSETAHPGEFRPVRVTVADNGREKRIAVTRPGYTVPGGNGAPAPATRPASVAPRPTGARNKS